MLHRANISHRKKVTRGIETIRCARAQRNSLTAEQLREKPVFVIRQRFVITAIDFNGSNKMQVLVPRTLRN